MLPQQASLIGSRLDRVQHLLTMILPQGTCGRFKDPWPSVNKIAHLVRMQMHDEFFDLNTLRRDTDAR
jgi:hypothetical protein